MEMWRALRDQLKENVNAYFPLPFPQWSHIVGDSTISVPSTGMKWQIELWLLGTIALVDQDGGSRGLIQTDPKKEKMRCLISLDGTRGADP